MVAASLLRRSFQQLIRPCHRGLASIAHSEGPPQTDNINLTADDIMRLSANKATRFVYLRTLPLVKQTELEGEVDLIASNIEEATKTVCAKHAETVPDSRAAVHLHTAALAIATHRVLSPRIKNEIRLSNIIRAGFGATLVKDPSEPHHAGSDTNSEKMRPDFWIVRAALWFSFDRMAAIRKMTANMVRDFGPAFETDARDEVSDNMQKHELIVRKCYYNTLCRKEGLPHLVKIFCALDRAIFAPITASSHGVEFSLPTTLAEAPDNDASTPDNSAHVCNFTFVKRK